LNSCSEGRVHDGSGPGRSPFRPMRG
jgi:hypothetical protein